MARDSSKGTTPWVFSGPGSSLTTGYSKGARPDHGKPSQGSNTTLRLQGTQSPWFLVPPPHVSYPLPCGRPESCLPSKHDIQEEMGCSSEGDFILRKLYQFQELRPELKI